MKHHWVLFPEDVKFNEIANGETRGFTSTCQHCGLRRSFFNTLDPETRSNYNYWAIKNKNENDYFSMNFKLSLNYIPNCKQIINLYDKAIIEDILK